MILNCVIIDDEPLAVDLLTSYVKKTPFLHLIGAFNSAVEGIRSIRENKVDLIFLDIQMPELSGLEFAKILSEETKIVFTTAFNQYAVDAYKVNAIDYLVKPISYEDFLSSANKALKWFSLYHFTNFQDKDRFIFVKSDHKLIQIRLDEISFIEGVKDYIKIYLDEGKTTVMSLMNMKKVEEFLPYPEFMRTHRSYIAHMTKVKLVDRFRLVYGDNYVPISESYKENVQNFIDGHIL